jgi:HAD superfamily hydrolase (TIGR01490 family)
MNATPSAAFFDVDGTLTRTNVVQYYVYFAQQGRPPWGQALWAAGFLLKVPYYLVVDRISRGRFNVVFYRNYRGWEIERLRELGSSSFRDVTRPRLYPAAQEAITYHRQEGRRVVFVTGTLDFIVAPLAEHLGVTDVIASQLQVEGGQATGELTGPPLGGEEKARQARLFAEQHGLDLAASFAYGDSRSDAPLLALVGHPVAVNPSRGLRRIAAERGWEVVRW